MKRRFLLLGIVLAVAAPALTGLALMVEDEFEHEEHDGLFPLCEGCHEGINDDGSDVVFPTLEKCVTCHDGVTEDTIVWSGASPTPRNLEYNHAEHMRLVDNSGDSATCQTCHAVSDATGRMDIRGPNAESCLTCHAHENAEHIAPEAECTSCHVPLSQALDIEVARIAEFPEPSSHESTNFLIEHGELAEAARGDCATCHTQDSCVRCHANGSSLPEVAGLEWDGRVALIVADKAAEYPEPVSHETIEWPWRHGEGISGLAGAEDCANCHTQPSCLSCHKQGEPAPVRTLPKPIPGGAPGVTLSAAATVVHRLDFSETHASAAAAGDATCESCHQRNECVSCHRGAQRPAFHMGNFLQMHGPEAYTAQSDCSSCHSQELFCRSCHEGAGLGSQGTLAVAFHDSQPLWLFGHGTAARQGLEGCVSCHSQVDCTRCHSAVGGWRISPHGPGFEAQRRAEKDGGGCALCHRVGGGR